MSSWRPMLVGSEIPPLPGSDAGTWRRIVSIAFQDDSTGPWYAPAHAGAGADPFWCELDEIEEEVVEQSDVEQIGEEPHEMLDID